MRKLLVMIFLVAGSATLSFAQTPGDQPKNQFFAGYSFNSADINTLTIDPRRTGQNGINLAYTRNITRHIGITGDGSAHFHRDTRNTTGSRFTSKQINISCLAACSSRPVTANGCNRSPMRCSELRSSEALPQTLGRLATYIPSTMLLRSRWHSAGEWIFA